MSEAVRFLTVVLLATFVVGCANVESVDHKDFTTHQELIEPAVGEKATITLGETLIRQQSIRVTPAIVLQGAYRTEWTNYFGTRMRPFTFEAGTTMLQAGLHEGTPIYTGPATGGVLTVDGRQIGAPYGIGVKNNGTVKYVKLGGAVIDETPGRSVVFEKVEAVAENPKNFRQEFIYSGRNDDALFFTYREFSGSLIRPAFTQNVTYSLSSGDTVAFKKLKLRILSATNSEITYKLVSTF